jgi:hypothetical protein
MLLEYEVIFKLASVDWEDNRRTRIFELDFNID